MSLGITKEFCYYSSGTDYIAVEICTCNMSHGSPGMIGLNSAKSIACNFVSTFLKRIS